jgi:hypothetical protein
MAFSVAIDCCARTKSKVTAVSVISKSIRCGLLDDGNQLQNAFGRPDVVGGQVERQADVLGPRLGGRERAHQQRLPQRPDQADALGGRNEVGRGNRIEAGTVPACQNLEARSVLAHGVHDRLEHQSHLGAELGGAQEVLDDAAAADLGLKLAREDHGAAAQLALGVIERIIGAFIERFRRRRGVRKQRKADRAG